MESVFKGVKIIDLSTVLAGPSVGTFFAELGASVIKIENPSRPDITRSWKLPEEDKDQSISAYFSSINYKKNYKSLNLKKEEDRLKLFQLAKNSDIVLMNYKYKGQEKLGIPDHLLRKENPQLIIGKINGYGSHSDRVAYDLILQAESGFMSMNGTPDSGPVKMPIALIDVLAAHHLREGLLLELYRKAKEENYSGKTISVSLYEAAISSLANQASNYLMTGFIPQRIGSLHPNIAPYGELFQTKDHRTITFAIGSNIHFKKLCEYLSTEDLINHPKYSTVQNRVENRSELFPILQSKIKNLEADDILDEMKRILVPCGEIKDLKSVFKSPLAQKMIRKEMIDEEETKRVTSIAFSRE